MRIEIPTYGRMAGKLHYGNGNAYMKDKDGVIAWSYQGKDFIGINIGACPRSGTKYISVILSKIGFGIGHETMGPDGSVGYHLAIIKPEQCLHQVRHPLKQIASMLAHRKWGFIQQAIELPDVELHGCMKLWFEWNQKLEDFCVWRYRIEELSEVWEEFCERVGHDKCEMPDVRTDTNKNKNTKKLTWADLHECNGELARVIYLKAMQYGYYPKGQMMPNEVQDNL